MNNKGIISGDDWDKGTAGESQSAKAQKVLKFLSTLEKGASASMVAIASGTGLKWPYSTVIALGKSGTIEAKKLGKAKYYRLKVRK
jgi:hypothetical protein